MTPAFRVPTLGRAEEVDHARCLLSQVVGGGRTFIVQGEAGIGKSRVVDEVLGLARGLGFQIFRGAAEELERHRPFGSIADCLHIEAGQDARRAEISRLLQLGAQRSVGAILLLEAPEAEFLIVEAMVGLVEELCAQAPVVLVLEDLQWADPSTRLVLHRVGRRLEHLPLLLIVTYRSTEKTSEVDLLLASLRGAGAVEMQLGALDVDASLEMAQQLVGAGLGPKLRQQVLGTGGNPLFITELISALRSSGGIKLEGQQAEIDSLALPASLADTILQHLSTLAEETLDVLRIASVLGTGFTVRYLSLMLQRSAVQLSIPLRRCISAGVLREVDARLVFTHELLRAALYEGLPLAVRLELHLVAARVLTEAGAPPSAVAGHLLRGASSGDTQAVEGLYRAAREIGPRSPPTAVELLQRAVELSGVSCPIRDAVLAELALNLAWLGRPAEAEAICREALGRTHDAAAEGTLRTCLVQILLAAERSVEAEQEASAAMASPAFSPRERAVFRAWGALARMLVGDFATAAQMGKTARADAEQLGEELAVCISAATLAGVAYFKGHLTEAVHLADEAAAAADLSAGQQAHRFPINLIRAMALAEADRPGAAQAAIREGRRIAEELGSIAPVAAYHWASGFDRFGQGEWDDALAECEACRDIADETKIHTGILFSYAVTALISIHRDRLQQAQAALEAATADLQRHGLRQLGLLWILWAQSLVAEATGRSDEARSILYSAWDLSVAAGLVIDQRALGPDLVRMALLAGDGGRAEEAVIALEALAADNPNIGTLIGAARRCRGLLEGDADLLLGAVDSYRQGSRPVELAMACEDAAQALATQGRAEEVLALFEEAIAIYERVGALRDIARAERSLRGSGFRRGRRGRRSRPESGWQSLTETELKVVRLVASGLSNRDIAGRLFLSHHTVNTHLSHVLAKLGHTSRVEIAAEVVRRAPQLLQS